MLEGWEWGWSGWRRRYRWQRVLGSNRIDLDELRVLEVPQKKVLDSTTYIHSGADQV